MPKQTFFNLPEEKKQNLIAAAEIEFSKVPLMKASVANIIKTAGIPRGSFYQYFENIEDLYMYLLEQETEKRKDDFISLLKKHQGDIIETVTEMYENFLVEMPDEEEHAFLKNGILNFTNKDGYSLTDLFDTANESKYAKDIIYLIDKKCLNINENNELIHIMQIIMAVVFRNFIEKFLKELSDEEAMNNFRIEMNLLKHGLYIRE
jgi:AcrR family transcriptional regulator